MLLRRKIQNVLKKIMEEKQIIGLLSFWLNECAAVGKSFAEKNSIPHYCWILGQDARIENKYPKRLAIQRDELIALSDFLQQEFERNHGVRPSKVIPPGMEVLPFKEHSREIDLLAVGSLIPLKQWEIFIETVFEIKKGLSEIKARIIGDGPERSKLEKLIHKLNLQDNISLAGALPYREVLTLMQQSKILIHPSSYEGFSGVCLEALSRGAHVVSFCKAMKQHIEHWHIVNSKEEMIQKAFYLLQKKIDHAPVAPFPLWDTTQKLMDLYQDRGEQVTRSSERTRASAF